MRDYDAVERILRRRQMLSKEEALANPVLAPRQRRPRRRQGARPVVLHRKPRRDLTKEDKMRIIFHRYGSLVNFDNPVMK